MDLPSGNGQPEEHRVRCTRCDFQQTSRGLHAASDALDAMITHARATGHTLRFNGKQQDLSAYLKGSDR